MGGRILIVFLTCLGVVSAGAFVRRASVQSVETAQPGRVELIVGRKFGYVIGDLIPYDAVIGVDPSWRLRTSSLPTPGRPEYWLELRNVAVDESLLAKTRVYRIHLTYQIFYAPIEARTRGLPGFALEFAHAGTASTIRVPELTITMSPLREVATGTGDPEQNVALEPDRAATVLPVRQPLLGIMATAVLTLGTLLYISWRRAMWPFARRGGPPFTRAERVLRSADPSEPNNYAAALLTLHRAFDTTAGWRVFADDVPRFLAQQPRFADAAAEITRFFMASRDRFFGVGTVHTDSPLPPAALLKLTHRLAAMERDA